jgi:hypothetical protein
LNAEEIQGSLSRTGSSRVWSKTGRVCHSLISCTMLFVPAETMAVERGIGIDSGGSQTISHAISPARIFFRNKIRRRNMVNKLLSALLTSLCLCLLLVFMEYTPGHERDEHTYYFTFSSLLMIYLIYAVPITIVAGIPLSLLIESIDKKIFIRSKVKRYFMQVGLFTLAGITVALIFLLMNSGNVLHRVFDLDRYLIFIIPSLLFYHISLVIRFINRKRKRHHDPLF